MNQQPRDLFKHCPACGVKRDPGAANSLDCPACGFRFYFNPAVAGAAIIRDATGKVLFIRRAKEPQRGKLAFPGGFVDIGERAEEALRREIREEVGLEVGTLEFLCSQPNEYHYKGVTYPVVDLVFTTRTNGGTMVIAEEEVQGTCWLEPEQVDPAEIAFISLRAAWAEFLQRKA